MANIIGFSIFFSVIQDWKFFQIAKKN